jgi:hypothetical protein
MDEFMEEGSKVVSSSLSWTSLEPEYVKIYAATFTTEEIDAITAFYRTPAGQSMLAKTPLITQASVKVAQARMVDLMPKMKALQDEYIAKMVAAQDSKSAAQPK